MKQTAEKSSHLLALPKELHPGIARHLPDSSLRALQLTCKALRNHYQIEAIWEERVRNLPMIPDYVFEHPDFKRLTINYRRLYGTIMSGGKGIATVLFQGVEPWQLAVLSGEMVQLSNCYEDTYRDFIDAGFKGFSEYLVYADRRQELLAWKDHHPEDFQPDASTCKKWPINAVTVGNISLLQWLVKNFGYDLKKVTMKSQQGEHTLLYEAVAQNQTKMLHWLIEQGVPYKGDRALMILAAKEGHWDIYEDLRKLGLEETFDEDCYQSVLLRAINHGNKSVFESHLKKVGFRFTKLTRSERDYLRELTQVEKEDYFETAVQSGSLEMVLCAIDKKAGWGFTIDHIFENRQNVLHIAASCGKVELIDQLVTKFSDCLDPRATDNLGNTILHESAGQFDFHVTMKLFQKYFSEDGHINKKKGISRFFSKKTVSSTSALLQPNRKGETIAHIAANNARFNYLFLLRKNFGDEPLRALDHDKNSVLHHACFRGEFLLIFWLVNTVGLSLVAVNKDGETPMHVLTRRALEGEVQLCRLEVILRTVDFRFLTDYKNKKKQTVTDMLMSGNEQELVEILKEEDLEKNKGAIPSQSHK